MFHRFSLVGHNAASPLHVARVVIGDKGDVPIIVWGGRLREEVGSPATLSVALPNCIECGCVVWVGFEPNCADLQNKNVEKSYNEKSIRHNFSLETKENSRLFEEKKNLSQMFQQVLLMSEIKKGGSKN